MYTIDVIESISQLHFFILTNLKIESEKLEYITSSMKTEIPKKKVYLIAYNHTNTVNLIDLTNDNRSM